MESAKVLPILPRQKYENSQIRIIKEAFDVINVTENQKIILKNRFTSLLEEYGNRSRKYSYAFHGLRLIITVGSLIVPAILSVQFTNTNITTGIYWVVWCLSLFVTISNATMTLLKIDKKYYVLNTVFQHIISEGWLYIELSGRYSGFKTPGLEPTHKNQFVYFCHSLEKIRMKQVEDEYFKLTEINNHANNPHPLDQLIPPTPLNANNFAITQTGAQVNIKSPDLINGGTTVIRQDSSTGQEYAGSFNAIDTA
jgi:hypothetical protein